MTKSGSRTQFFTAKENFQIIAFEDLKIIDKSYHLSFLITSYVNLGNEVLISNLAASESDMDF